MKKLTLIAAGLIATAALVGCTTTTEETTYTDEQLSEALDETIEEAGEDLTEAITEGDAPVVDETAEKEADEEVVGLANPMTEVSSLEDINNEIGSTLVTPGVMGVTDEKFYIIDAGTDFKIGEYRFTVNGVGYSFRCGADYETDISGVWFEDATAYEGHKVGELDYVSNDEYKLGRWADVNCQYILMAQDNGSLDEELFETICEELKTAVTPDGNAGV